MKRKRKNRFFVFQAFVIGVVLVIVIGLTRGIIYEEELARAQYPPGISVLGISKKGLYGYLGPLPLDYINAAVEQGGMLTEYWDAKMNGSGHDYLGTNHLYLEVFNPNLRAGRYFTKEEQDQLVCLVSESLAKQLYGTIANSLGHTFSSRSLRADLEIIGVIEDGTELPVKTVDINGYEQYQFRLASNRFVIYPAAALPLEDWMGLYRSIWLEGNVIKARALANYLERLDFEASYAVNPFPAQYVPDPQSQSILIAVLVGFACLVMIVAALGMFGMQMIQVIRRRQEIGLRMAVGAMPHHVLKLILTESMLTILIPSSAGAAVGYLLHPVISRLAFPVLFDGALVLIAFGVLVVFTVLVGFYPAWKGATLDPIECLGKTPRLN
ncbi:MAG: FtsX-like permease family protein [Firmicutes bacterium]|nr:FtsX-like permease family protein [Bacillota bacterium]NLL88297.1 FtsX-like permease family protein [Bacillota bacterium]HKM18335.1 FtsX-like permease family protein [Limnochordia bacterium]